LLDRLECEEADVEALKDEIMLRAAPFMRQIELLTSMKGVSVFTAIAIIAYVIDAGRFRNSKAFTSCLRSAPGTSGPTLRRASGGRAGRGASCPRPC